MLSFIAVLTNAWIITVASESVGSVVFNVRPRRGRRHVLTPIQFCRSVQLKEQHVFYWSSVCDNCGRGARVRSVTRGRLRPAP